MPESRSGLEQSQIKSGDRKQGAIPSPKSGMYREPSFHTWLGELLGFNLKPRVELCCPVFSLTQAENVYMYHCLFLSAGDGFQNLPWIPRSLI
jgi:hypothetical protein